MIKVNLISKKSGYKKGQNWTKLVVLILFGLIGLYFLIASFYVVISMLVLNKKISNTKAESTAVSTAMLGNDEKLSRFVLTKLILTEIAEINSDRFHYKDYLDQVSLLLPNGSLLSSVAFTTKGWISISVSSDDVNSFELLENSLINESTWKDNKFFSGAYIESVNKDKTGEYSTKLQLELRKLNG